MVRLLVAAGRESLKDWTEFVGEGITELAFLDELENDETNVLYSHLRYPCRAVPELWVTCDRRMRGSGQRSIKTCPASEAALFLNAT